MSTAHSVSAVGRVHRGLVAALAIVSCHGVGAQTPTPAAPTASAASASKAPVLNPLHAPAERWAMRGLSFVVPAVGLQASGMATVDDLVLTGAAQRDGGRHAYTWIVTTSRAGDAPLSVDEVQKLVRAGRESRFQRVVAEPAVDAVPARADGALCFDYREQRAASPAGQPGQQVRARGRVCEHPSNGLWVQIIASEYLPAGVDAPTADWDQAVQTSLDTLRFTPLDMPAVAEAAAAFKAGDGAAGRAALARAAAAGAPVADFLLARRLALGDGLPADGAAALTHAQRAAEAGVRDAKMLLGLMYQQGIGTPRNPLAAARWFEKAADMRHGGAQMALAEMLRTPVSGGLADDARACRYAEMAELNGYTRATEALQKWSCQRRLTP